MAGFNDIEVPRSSSYVKLSDHVEPLDLSHFAGETVDVRILSGEHNPMIWEAVHWVYVPNSKEGATSKYSARSFNCLDFDNVTGKNHENSVCPFCKAGHNPQRRLIVNVLVREYQEDKPARIKAPTASEAESGFKDVIGGSKAWTPKRVWSISANLVMDIKTLGRTNKRKVTNKAGESEVRVFDITDPKFGRDLTISYNPDHKVAAKKTMVSLGDNKSALTKEEMGYLTYRLDAAVLFPKPKLATVLSFIKANIKGGIYSSKALESKNRLAFDRAILSDSGNEKMGVRGKDFADDSDDDDSSGAIDRKTKAAVAAVIAGFANDAEVLVENDNGDKVVAAKVLRRVLKRAELESADIVNAVADVDDDVELDEDFAEEIAFGSVDLSEIFDEDDDGNLIVELKKKSKAKKKAAAEPDEDDFMQEEPAPKKKKKVVEPEPEDDDSEDDDDSDSEEDEDEDEESVADSEDGEDGDDEDFDEPPKKSKRPTKKPDFNFDDDDDLDD